jgi:HK97 family phage major capsid protein
VNHEAHRLHTARLRAWNEMQAISERANQRDGEEQRLTADEESAWQKANDDINAIDARIAVLLEMEQRNADIEAAMTRFGSVDAPEAPADELSVEQQLRALGRGELRTVAVPFESRDLTKGTATAGGNTVPTSFAGSMWEHMIEVSAILQAGATIISTASGENLEIPVTTTHSSGALITEGSTLTESDPAFAKRTLGAYKYGMSIQVSSELVADTGTNLLDYLARQAGRAVGNALGTDLVTGNASSKPSGIVQTATTGVTGATTGASGAFTADELIDLYYSVISPYRASTSCAWIMRDATVARVRKLKGSDNNYLWQPGLTVGAPDLLLGKPVYTDPNVAAVATSAKSVIFGDIAAYHVRLAGGVRFERSDDFAFQSDLVTFRAIVRGDGILADQTGAVKLYVGAST